MDSNVLSLDSIRDFMVLKGGRVTNHELVQHFKEVLTDPVTRDEARIRFKEYINTLATLTRDSEGGKQLVLKKRFRMSHPELQSGSTSPAIPSSLPISPLQAPSLNLQYQPVYHTSHDSIDSLVSPLRHTYRRLSQDSLGSYSLKSPVTPTLTTPTYKGPIAAPIGLKRNISQDSVFGSSIFEASTSSMKEADPPPVPPRRKSSDKMRLDYPPEEQKPVESAVVPSSAPPPQETLPTDIENKENVADENKISVKERMQKFDRMASESALNKTSLQNNNSKKRHERVDKDEDDSGSVALLDGKSKEWIVKCAQCDYQAIVKMAAENPKLIKLKTALHWGAKHGNQDVIKLVAGKHGADVNQRTGFTALHIAMQYGHDDVYNLLVEVYGADPHLRDWSGKKARQYQTNKGMSVSADTFRKIKARKKQAEKDLGFLRIGSLNVRVKRTTEAFSNFLGVGNTDKLHKNWGSADNLHQAEQKKMPPPKFGPIKKRKSKRAQDFSSKTHLADRTHERGASAQDSDSDTAAGFGSAWQSTV